RTLASADLVALLLAYLTAAPFYSSLRIHWSLIAFLVALPLWVVAARCCGLYDGDDRRPGHSTLDELIPLARLLTVGAWTGGVLMWLAGRHGLVGGAVLVWASSIVLVPPARISARAALRRGRACAQ